MLSGTDDPRRRSPRRRVEEACCDMGEVLDVSATGIRVSCKRKPPLKTGHVGRLKLRAPDGAISISARAVWMRRKGLLGGYEVGLQFVNLEPAARKALASLAEFGFFRSHDGVNFTMGGRGRSRSGVHADMTLPDYYDLLGVARDAGEEEIRSAFRKLARQYHPDAGGPDADEQKFIEINQAYEVLGDPSRRKQFDLSLI